MNETALGNSKESENKPDHFELLESHAVFRLKGEMSLEKCVGLVTTAITHAREQGMRKLLVVVTEVYGFPPPSVSARYFFIQEWARAAGGKIRLALATRPELIDQDKFGVTVAANNGLTSGVFAAEAEALAWLQDT